LIAESVATRLTVRALSRADYVETIDLVAREGLGSGAVYDALHVVAARKSQSERILTYNLRHFRELTPDHMTVATP